MTDSDRDKRLIEVEMPLEKISEESRREKNIRHGNPSTMHLWWARRPLSASRAAAYASLIEDPDEQSEREEQLEFIEELSTWEAVTDEEILSTAKDKVLDKFDGEPPRTLDPFSGGGALPLESQRIGCESHAVELNPVACALIRSEMEFPYLAKKRHQNTGSTNHGTPIIDTTEKESQLISDVKNWSEWLQDEVSEEIGDIYGDDIIGYIWARTLPCQSPGCDLDIPLVRQFWLSDRDNSDKVIYNLDCDTDGTVDIEILEEPEFEIFSEGNKRGIEVNGSGEKIYPTEGTVQRGSVSCPACNNSFKSDRTRELSKKEGFGRKLLVVIADGNNGKEYRVPNNDDIDKFISAEKKLEELDSRWIPDEPLPPEGSLGIRVNLYEYDSWGQLYNPRQQLVMATFCKKVNQAYDEICQEEDEEYAKAIATYLSLGIDRLADYNSNLTMWIKDRETVGHVFSRGALPIRWDYVEVNPFSGSTGDYSGAIDWITRAIETCSYATGVPEINLGDATQLNYPDNHFDAVFTDPPYYDNMPYATISDYFYVWLKRSIGELYPDEFSTPLTPKTNEIIEDSSRHENPDEAEEFFETKLSDAFSEISRVLDSDGICTIVFAHKSTDAWAQMIRGLLSSDLVVTATWPIHTERHNRPRGIESAALSSSVYFVCRNRSGTDVGYYNDVQEELREKVHDRLDYFWEQGIRGADLLVSAIGPAVQVFGQYEDVKRLSGEKVSIDELLEETQRLVSDYALGKVLEGDVELGRIDPETRFYILFRWAFANQKEDYDEVRKLAQVNEADTERLERLGIMDVSRGDATLVPPQSRKLDEPEKVPKGNNLPLVDKIQRAAVLWESGNREELKSFIEEHCMSDEFWRSAQAISECLPEAESKSKKEKQMLHGLLGYGGQTDFEGSGQSTLEKYTNGEQEQ